MSIKIKVSYETEEEQHKLQRLMGVLGKDIKKVRTPEKVDKFHRVFIELKE